MLLLPPAGTHLRWSQNLFSDACSSNVHQITQEEALMDQAQWLTYHRFRRNMSKRNHPVWDHFNEDPNEPSNVVCQIPGCKHSTVSRGKPGTPKGKLSTSSMTQHLKSRHPKVHHDVLEAQRKSKADTQGKKIDEEENNELENIPTSSLRSGEQKKLFIEKQLSLDGWISGSKFIQGDGSVYEMGDPRAKNKHRGILTMFVLDLQPFSMVEDRGFILHCHVMDPHFKPGCPKFYKETMEKCYKIAVEKVTDKIRKDEPDAVAAQTDGWSEHQNCYLGLIVSYITKKWKRVNLVLNCEKFNISHSGENMGAWLEEKLDEWHVLTKTTVVVSDSASNMIKLFEFLPQYLDIQHSRCLNHILNTVVTGEILEKPEIKKLVQVARDVSNFPNKSPKFAEALRDVFKEKDSPELKLIQDVKTRWNSTHDMLKRMVEIKDVVQETLKDEKWKEDVLKGASIREKDWNLMENIVRVLDPFKSATETLSKDTACISEYIPIVTCILRALKTRDADEGVVGLKKRLHDNLFNRMKGIETDEKYFMSTLLDARYKNKFFRDESSKDAAEKHLIQLVERSCPAADELEEDLNTEEEEADANDNILANMFEQVRNEANAGSGRSEETVASVVNNYLTSKLEKNNLHFWSQFEDAANPIRVSMCKLAKKFLTPPATSTLTERLFSHAGNIRDRRESMKPETLEKLLFLGENLKLNNFALDW